MSRIVELRWTCSECGTKDILGREKRCPQCGAPRDKGEMQMDGLQDASARESVVDADVLDLANAGADWFCGYCGAGNRGDGDACATCHAVRAQAEDRAPAKPEAPPAPAPKKRGGWGLVGVAVVLLGCAGAGATIWGLFFRTTPSEGFVSALRWEHTTIRETWTPTTKEAWRDDLRPTTEKPPVDGAGEVPGIVVGACRDKHHHDEKVACGTERVCRAKTRTESYSCGETCTDNGNGFATCTPKTCTRTVPDGETCTNETKYCDKPVYASWCSYSTQEWRPAEQAVAKGEGAVTSWKELRAGARDRIRKEGRYEVDVTYLSGKARKVHTEETADAAQFARYKPGDRVKVDVTALGAVKGVAKVE